MTSSPTRLCALFAPLVLSLALAGCETTGSGASQAAAPAPEPPMTHSRAAMECWMNTEKGAAKTDLDKRADIVTKCIDEKMKAAAPATPAAPKT